MTLRPDEVEELLQLAPSDFWRTLARMLRAARGTRGSGRKIVAEIGLADADGRFSAPHSWITPPRVGVKPD